MFAEIVRASGAAAIATSVGAVAVGTTGPTGSSQATRTAVRHRTIRARMSRYSPERRGARKAKAMRLGEQGVQSEQSEQGVSSAPCSPCSLRSPWLLRPQPSKRARGQKTVEKSVSGVLERRTPFPIPPNRVLPLSADEPDERNRSHDAEHGQVGTARRQRAARDVSRKESDDRGVHEPLDK